MNNKLTKSASLIVSSALGNQKSGLYDFKIMLLKRSSKMRVSPNYHVFPGGKFDLSVDQSLDWLKIFFNSRQLYKIKNEPRLLKQFYFNRLINQKSIGNLTTQSKVSPNDEADLSIPMEISFRLCAIRETFEETGLLLAQHKDNSSQSTIITDYYQKNSRGIKKWHQLVKKDSKQFLNMCLALDLVPNVFGLHEWANWITPTHEKRRFDTFFFTCFLPNLPNEDELDVNKDEIESLEVVKPDLNSNQLIILKF